VLPAPRVQDGLTISPSPFRKQADSKAPTDHIPDNGIVERFHKTVLDEFYRVAFRKKIYGSIGELQSDLDDGQELQRGKAAPGTMVLRQDADANLP
jgi:hypothetical protein